jgi:hypothetical protein
MTMIAEAQASIRGMRSSINEKIQSKEFEMRGNTIAQEYQKMVWVRDEHGAEYVCYAKDLKNDAQVSDKEKERCLDTSAVVGADW